MLEMITLVAGQLGVGTAVATTIVNVILDAGTLVTVLGILASIASGGATVLMTMGWSAFKAAVKAKAKQSMFAAVAY